MAQPVLAIDIGGTTMAVAGVDAGGRISASARVPTPHGRHTDAETLWRTLTGLVRSVAGERRVGLPAEHPGLA